MQRTASVKGSFYPKSCREITQHFETYNTTLQKVLKDKSILSYKPRAIIVPHAGYIYSGFTANLAYRLLANTKAKRTIVIGPSHHAYFTGISGSFYDTYETPCAALPIDLDYLNKLKKHFAIGFAKKAHQKEHSTEVQMPFIQHYLPHTKVIELIYGQANYQVIAKLCFELLKDKDNVVVISTDLSHYYTQEQAKKLDYLCLEGIMKKDLSILDKGCEACGLIGVKAILEVAKKANFQVELLDYRTSADASGDKNRVVGYLSAAIG